MPIATNIAAKQTRRQVCVVTGSRADYGLLYWLLKEIDACKSLQRQLIVTGAHLSQRHGLTRRLIEDDGFAVDAEVENLVDGDTPSAAAKSMARCLDGMTDALSRLAPNIVVVLGDRYEILAAAEAAMILGIPIAHIHGGELTEGVIDDRIRHALTKMADLHFVAADAYRRRVVQLGEPPARVFEVGPMVIDHIRRTEKLDRDALGRKLGFDLARPYFLVTYHPELGAPSGETARGAEALVTALEAREDHALLITGVNADPGREPVVRIFKALRDRTPERTLLVDTLGHKNYLSAMVHAAAVVGNSSSGIIEAPILGVPTVNVGNRQNRRLYAASIINVAAEAPAITAALDRATDKAFRAGAAAQAATTTASSPARAITDVLTRTDLTALTRKPFHDVPVADSALVTS